MPSSVFTLSTRTAARTGSLNNGVTGTLCNRKISMSAPQDSRRIYSLVSRQGQLGERGNGYPNIKDAFRPRLLITAPEWIAGRQGTDLCRA
jgi:hypothetical protein